MQRGRVLRRWPAPIAAAMSAWYCGGAGAVGRRDHARVGDERAGLDAERERLAGAVEDRAALGGQRDVGVACRCGGRAQVAGLHGLHDHELERGHAEHQHQQRPGRP